MKYKLSLGNTFYDEVGRACELVLRDKQVEVTGQHLLNSPWRDLKTLLPETLRYAIYNSCYVICYGIWSYSVAYIITTRNTYYSNLVKSLSEKQLILLQHLVDSATEL